MNSIYCTSHMNTYKLNMNTFLRQKKKIHNLDLREFHFFPHFNHSIVFFWKINLPVFTYNHKIEF